MMRVLKVDYVDDHAEQDADDGKAEGDGCGVPRNLVFDLSGNSAKSNLKSRPGYIAKGRPVFAEYLI